MGEKISDGIKIDKMKLIILLFGIFHVLLKPVTTADTVPNNGATVQATAGGGSQVPSNMNASPPPLPGQVTGTFQPTSTTMPPQMTNAYQQPSFQPTGTMPQIGSQSDSIQGQLPFGMNSFLPSPIPGLMNNLASGGGILPSSYQQGQMPYQPGQMPNQQGQMPYQQGQMPFQQGQMPFQQGQMPFQQGQMPYQQGQMPFQQGGLPSNSVNPGGRNPQQTTNSGGSSYANGLPMTGINPTMPSSDAAMTNAQLATLLENPLTKLEAQNMISNLYQQRMNAIAAYLSGINGNPSMMPNNGMASGPGGMGAMVPGQSGGGFGFPFYSGMAGNNNGFLPSMGGIQGFAKSKFDMLINGLRAASSKNTWNPLITPFVDFGTDVAGSGVTLLEKLGSAVLEPSRFLGMNPNATVGQNRNGAMTY